MKIRLVPLLAALATVAAAGSRNQVSEGGDVLRFRRRGGAGRRRSFGRKRSFGRRRRVRTHSARPMRIGYRF